MSKKSLKEKNSSIFQNFEFLKLWFAQIISYTGDRMSHMAILGILSGSGTQTAPEMANITFFSVLPGFLFGQVAGMLSDSFSRKKLLIITDILRAIFLIIFLFLLKINSSIYLLYIFAFLVGTCTAFFYPAKLAIVPNLVSSNQLKDANALGAGTAQFATLIGSYLGGFIVSKLGVDKGFIINIFTYILSAVFLLSMRVPESIREINNKFEIFTLNDFKFCVNYLRSHKKVLNSIYLAIGLSVQTSFFYISLTAIATDHFKLNSEGYGKVLAILGLGMILGAAFIMFLKKTVKMRKLLIYSFLTLFLVTITSPVVNSWIEAWIWLIILGASNSVILVSLDTFLQKSIPDRFRGKIFGFRSAVQTAFFLIGILSAGFCVKRFSPFSIFQILGIFSFLLSLVIIIQNRFLAYKAIRFFVSKTFKFIYNVQVDGIEHINNINSNKGCILAGNHTGWLDIPIIAGACKRPITFMAHENIFKWFFIKNVLEITNMLKVSPGNSKETLAKAVERANKGEMICIFPEGKLSKDGGVDRFHRGVIRIHKNAKAPIIPFSIHGGYEAWAWNKKLPKLRKLYIQFGEAIQHKAEQKEDDVLKDLQKRVEFMKASQTRKENYEKEDLYANSVLSLMESKSDIYGHKVALAIKDKNHSWRELTYIELSRKSLELSDWLIEQGIEREDRIAIFSESCPEWSVVLFANIRTGAITVPLDIKLTEKELESILSDCKPRILFVSKDLLKKTKHLQEQITSLEKIIILDEGEIFKLKAKNSYTGRERRFDDTALIIYTSGTTGSPKGVMTSFGNLIFQVRAAEELDMVENNARLLSILPLNHLFELTCGLLAVLHKGGSVFYSKSLSPKEITTIMQEKKITHMITVPLFLNVLKNSIENKINSLSTIQKQIFELCFNFSQKLPVSLRRILFFFIHNGFGGKFKAFYSGGSPLSVDIANFFETIGINVYQGYGLTETSPIISTNTKKKNLIGSVGKPLKGVQIKLIKENVLQEEGEICVRGPHIMKGYYNREDLTKEILEDDYWFHTGDIGKLDKEGYLYITGRLKNLIVLAGGKKVHPEEVEIAFAKINLIKEMCVLGIAEKEKEGEEVCLVAVPSDFLVSQKNNDLKEIEKVIIEEVKKVSEESLATYKRPTKIIIRLEELPKTSTKKVKRKDLLKELNN